ncbi:olfactory receptor 1A1-like [Sturnira hondurensis]|uniref:olfactory receptor 1A1-like n=1 Tax=Sturnira hondurensis TaxID=192404 RepID=UPI00187A2A76|nr:olfactory receptor 1A1-like [Sturnira hondurensis]
MREDNRSSALEFILLGVSRKQEQEDFFFILFLFIYPITLIGNLFIILAIRSDIRLHNPMYFLLANLSFVDIFFSSVTIPKMLANHLLGTKAISFGGCLTQIYFMIALGNTDSYILAAMAYNRAVAISRPLHYTTIMSPGLCVLLVSSSWITSGLSSLLHTLLVNSLSFCAEHKIPHFFCDIIPLLRLSCTDTFINELVIFSIGGLTVLGCVLCLIISYAYIFLTIWKIPSTQGKKKALSTCSSHLSVVSLFFGTSSSVYFSPASTPSSLNGALASMMYTAVTPMLNPFIYSLRNRDIKSSLRKLIWVRKIYFPQW